jgi:hypothetical protein
MIGDALTRASTVASHVARIRAVRLDALLYLATAIVFIAASIPYAAKAGRDASAFVRWHNQIAELFSAADVYDNIYMRHGYPNPPPMALILYPLTLLPPLAGALVWYYLKVGAVLISAFWTFRMIETPLRPFPAWAKGLVLLLSLKLILGDLTHGNVNLFILFLVVGALYAFQQRRDWLAGFVLALAIACKVTPLLFVPYLIWKRAWKTLAGCAAGVFCFVLLVPGGLLGWKENTQLMRSWVEQMANPYLIEGAVLYTQHTNQSLPALTLRLTTASPSFITYLDGQLAPAEYHNLIDIGPRWADWIIRGCMALFAGLVIWLCRTPLDERRGWRLPAEFSLVLLGMLLFSERTWKHHCVTWLVPLAVLVYFLATGDAGAKLRRYLIATLSAIVLLTTLTSNAILGDHAAKMVEVYGVYVWANLLMAIALCAVLACRFASPNTVPDHST